MEKSWKVKAAKIAAAGVAAGATVHVVVASAYGKPSDVPLLQIAPSFPITVATTASDATQVVVDTVDRGVVVNYPIIRRPAATAPSK